MVIQRSTEPATGTLTPVAVPPAAPTFSVVIATRNRAELLRAQVSRMLMLSGAPEQIVIVDDGSTDETPNVINEACGAASVPDSSRGSSASSGSGASAEGSSVAALTEVLSVVGAGDGPASARNLGLKLVDSDFTIFLDDDDIPLDDWMDTFRSLASSKPDVAYASTSLTYRTPTRSWKRAVGPVGWTLPVPPAYAPEAAMHLSGTFAARTADLRAIGGFTDGLRWMEFTDLIVRLFRQINAVGGAVVADADAHIEIVRPTDGDRESTNWEYMRDAMERVVIAHESEWRQNAPVLANQYAAAGVAAYRAGETELGRRWLFRAWVLQPASLRHAARAATGILPPIAQRRWPAHGE